VTGQDQDLQFLLDLALDKSLESRKRLAAQISDLTSDHEHALTERERDLIAQILKKLLTEFEVPVRRRMSERLAGNREAPHDLVVALANDQIAVARPILVQSNLLHDPELIEIIRHRGRQHQMAIAQRRSLSESVSEALVETDDENVITTLLENKDAKISEATMAYLVEQSKRVDSFHEPLVNRSDLSLTLAEKLFWFVAAALRSQIIKTYDIHPTQLDDAIEDTIHQIARDEAKTDRTGAGDNAAWRLARELKASGRLTPDLLIKALRQGEVPLFEALLGEMSGITPPRLQRIIYDTGGEGLAIACRSLKLPKQTFATIFMLSRNSGRVMRPQELSRATTIFDKVSVENAEHIMETWRRDPNYQDAIERIESSLQGQEGA